MGTEEEIVYSIIETATKGNNSDDNRIDERIIRSFLRTYRAGAINKNSGNGVLISDECFQYVGFVKFEIESKTNQYSASLPKIIMLKEYGLYFELDGESIPLLPSEEFNLSLKSLINRKLPKAKKDKNKFVVYVGENTPSSGNALDISNPLVNLFKEQIKAHSEYVQIDVYAILEDPDDAFEYDWTKSPYPLPSELVKEIKAEILQKEFNVMLSLNSDKITDSNDKGFTPTYGQKERRQQQSQ